MLAGQVARDLFAEVAAQGKHVRPAEGVVDGPRLGLHADEGELRRQVIVLRRPGVDARGVRGQRRLGLGAQMRPGRFRRVAQAEGAQPDVLMDAVLAEDLAEAPVDHAALHLQLPEAVLRVHVPGGEERVAVIARRDVRNAVPVAPDLHRRADARHGDAPARRRQRGPQLPPGKKPSGCARHEHEHAEARQE